MQNLRLLIIEDDSDQRELMRETLQQHFVGSTIIAVESGKAALAEDLGTFHMILTDYNLPDCSGMDLLGKIIQICSTPVIMVTGENVGQIAAEAIRKGATDYIVKLGDYLFTIPLAVEKNLMVADLKRENDALRDELEQALWEVKDKNCRLEESLQKLEEMAATDPLTGLYNRRHFGKVLDQLFAEAQRYDKDLTCMMIDLDGYKQMNDAYGHQIGDQLLVLAGKVISANLRRMDIAARYGGDEFVLLLPHADANEAAGVAERIREEYRKASSALLHRRDGISMSIGIGSLIGNHPSYADQLVAMADTALYRAKDTGRNRIVLSSLSADIPQI